MKRSVHHKVLYALFLSFTLPLLATSGIVRAEVGNEPTSSSYQWQKMKVDVQDYPSLQRGFALFINYCSGCHSLQYMRYDGVAKDIGITDQKGKVLEVALKENLIFNNGKPSDSIQSSIRREDGIAWFGIAPPDLTLVTRVRGSQWVYNYLLAFYPDPTKLWGVNNYVYPNAAMPNVLENMQKHMSPDEFNHAVRDIVNFLAYAGEPHQQKRKFVGVFVLLFLGIFTLFAMLLKREYWKDIK